MNVLHMKKGTGEGSYAKNSKVQSIIISMTKHVVEEAIAKTLQSADDVPDTLGVADLGCGSGPNTLSVMSAIIKAVHTRCSEIGCRLPELRMSLNDLPDNDFNSVFSVLEPGFYREMMVEKELCFISGVPGSFYGRLFPRNSLHFVYSSSSVHWLSQVPPCLQTGKNNHPTIVNKGSVYINKTSSKGVVQSYVEQFQNDFKVFLESRSAEVVSGGRMVLSLYGRMSPQHTDEMNENAIFELLTQALMTLVSKGIVEEEKVDSFNMPIYSPSADELESAIHEEGSFSIEHLDSFVVGWDQDPAPVGNAAGFNLSAKTVPKITFGQRMVTILRSIVEALLESQFGMEVVNDIATTAALILDENPAKYRLNYVNIVVSLVRK